MAESLGHKTVKSSVWSILDVLMRQGIGFVISVVLARLLTPSDYGTIGLIMIFISIANVFVDSGFGAALIRKVDRTNEDLNTAFFFNVFVGIIVYLILFVSAPYIASFFNNYELTDILRVLGLILIINSFNIVQNAIMIYSMRIKRLALLSAISQISTGLIAIYFAYQGLGVWTLVIQQLGAALLNAILLIVSTKWNPKFVLSRKSFDYLWGFGSRLLTATLIGTIFNQGYSFVIGKMLGKRDLGLFTRSEHFTQQPVNIVTNIINKSLVPSLAHCQDDLHRMQLNYKKIVEIISVIIFPLMFLLSTLSEPLFITLFGYKWIAAIPIFRILCIGYAFDIFSTLGLQLMQVMGRTDYTLKLEFIKKPIYALIIVISLFYELKGLVIGKAIYCLVAAMINSSVIKSLLKYDYWRQMWDIVKYAFISIIILIPVYFVIHYIWNNNIFQILSVSVIFILLYILVLKLLKMPALTLVCDVIRSFKK